MYAIDQVVRAEVAYRSERVERGTRRSRRRPADGRPAPRPGSRRLSQ